MRTTQTILLSWIFAMGFARSQAPLNFEELKASYDSSLQDVVRDFNASSAAAEKHYRSELGELARELQKLGDLHAVVWIKRELQRFGAMNVIPDDALAPAETAIRTLQERYRKGAQKAESLKARKTYALTSTYLEKVDYQIRLYTARNEAAMIQVMNAEIQRVKTSTAFTRALACLNRQPAPAHQIPIKAKVAPGNVALVTKGALGIAENRSFEMIDGNSDKYDLKNGFSQGRCPADFMIFLAHVYTLDRIRIKLNELNDQKYTYRIETSVDTENWLPLLSQEAAMVSGWQTHTFPPRAVQDIRIRGLFNSGGPHFNLVEVEAYCPVD
ncbi:MAG: hypothetical protein VCG02_17900 [Verrucomicrobiota bacterium]